MEDVFEEEATEFGNWLNLFLSGQGKGKHGWKKKSFKFGLCKWWKPNTAHYKEKKENVFAKSDDEPNFGKDRDTAR